MFEELLLTQPVRDRLYRLAEKTPHALVLVGSDASTLQTARLLAAVLLGTSTDKLEAEPYFRQVIIEKDKTSIGIEQIHLLRPFLALKTAGEAEIRRVCIITMAQTLLSDAQNALLKMLEEPPADTVFISCCSDLENMLSTIRSRSVLVPLLTPPLTELREHFSRQFDELSITKAFHLSGGEPELMQELLLSRGESPWYEAAEVAKSLLTQKPFERLGQLDRLAKDKQLTERVLAVLKQLCKAKLRATQAPEQTTAWRDRLLLVMNAQQQLGYHAQAKLVWLNVLLSL